MKKRISLITLFLISAFYSQVLFATTVYYVQSSYAKIVAEPSFSAKVVTVIGSGEQLTSTGREGNWIKVSFHNHQGYVHSLLLSTRPPLRKTQLISSNDSEINNGVRRRSSTFMTAAATRGLTKEDHNRSDNEDAVDFEALKKMESLVLTDTEIDKFIGGDKK